jgi:hypothetical protein
MGLDISVVNRSRTLADADVLRALRAINRQLAEDVEPHWKFGARLRLDGVAEPAKGRLAPAARPRGDAVITIADRATAAGSGAEGYHDKGRGDVAVGFVFLDVCRAAGDAWTAALSHEAIELMADPLNNLLVQGPHPRDRRRQVFHAFELCDAVQAEGYEVDGVAVSNFVLPGWFATPAVPGLRNDFLGRPQRGTVLAPFGMAPGGSLTFFDPALRRAKWTTATAPDDAAAERRVAARRAAGLTRIARRIR